MTTYRKVIEGAYLDIGVKAAETPITAAEIQTGLEKLNDMLAEWDITSVIAGIDQDEDADTDMMEPRGWKSGIQANLATRLAGQFERTVSTSLAIEASEGYNTIVASQYNQQDFEFPDTLPTGSGNCNSAWLNQEFFGNNSRRNF